MKILAIGYGNPSRNDDGVGWVVIEQLKKLALPDVELMTAHQLEVEMTDTIQHFDAVIFVDAATPRGSQAVGRTVVQPRFEHHAVAHFLTPADLIALCQTLYGRRPHAILFSIRGHNFNFGSLLSSATEHAARDVVRQIMQLIPMLRQYEVRSMTGKTHA
jgi:hydrogenase maturation protease